MQKIIKGKVFVYGANIDTDQIYPGRFLELTDPEDVGKHAMEGVDPGFVIEFQPGDIIVASTNFGCGSSREQAAITLKARGLEPFWPIPSGGYFTEMRSTWGSPWSYVPLSIRWSGRETS